MILPLSGMGTRTRIICLSGTQASPKQLVSEDLALLSAACRRRINFTE